MKLVETEIEQIPAEVRDETRRFDFRAFFQPPMGATAHMFKTSMWAFSEDHARQRLAKLNDGIVIETCLNPT